MVIATRPAPLPAAADPPRRSANHLLAALPRAEYARLRPHLQVVHRPIHARLYAPDEPIAHVYFPLSGIASMVATMRDGATVEVGTTGNEGFVGLPALLGVASTPFLTLVQAAGDFARLPLAAFRAACGPATHLHGLLDRYAHALFTLAGQSGACNRLHTVGTRCARWLLLTHDRLGADTFPLTHEYLGQMLGVRRASVTLAAGGLARAGLLTYHRGIVTIRDRAGLEAASCECYGAIRDEFARQLASA